MEEPLTTRKKKEKKFPRKEERAKAKGRARTPTPSHLSIRKEFSLAKAFFY